MGGDMVCAIDTCFGDGKGPASENCVEVKAEGQCCPESYICRKIWILCCPKVWNCTEKILPTAPVDPVNPVVDIQTTDSGEDKIDDEDERSRLKGLIDKLKIPEDFGLIVRTVGMNCTKTLKFKEFWTDMAVLELFIWQLEKK